MKTKVMIETEVEIADILIEVAVRYEDQDIPNDFPLRDGDIWRGTVELDTGKIKEWPKGKYGRLAMKVTDSGTYTLLGPTGKVIACKKEDYVPDCVPGEYGDYIDLDIDENGVVKNWNKHPDVSEFFQSDE